MKNQVTWKHQEMERKRAEAEHRKMNRIRICVMIYYLIQICSITMLYFVADTRYGFIRPIFYTFIIAGFSIVSSGLMFAYSSLRSQPGWKSEYERTQWLVDFIENASDPVTISGVIYPDHYVLDPQEIKHMSLNADEKVLIMALEDVEGQQAGLVMELDQNTVKQLKKRQGNISAFPIRP